MKCRPIQNLRSSPIQLPAIASSNAHILPVFAHTSRRSDGLLLFHPIYDDIPAAEEDWCSLLPVHTIIVATDTSNCGGTNIERFCYAFITPAFASFEQDLEGFYFAYTYDVLLANVDL